MDISDAGKHCSDAVNLALALGGMGKWVAARLSDGKTDGNTYDTKADAVKHAIINHKLLHESQAAYIKIPPGGMPPEDASRYLLVVRKLYDNGMRIVDPDTTIVMPNTMEEFNNIFRKVRK